MKRIYLFSTICILSSVTFSFAQGSPSDHGAEQVKLEIAALISAALYMFVDTVVKPFFKKLGVDITSQFKLFQPLLLSLSAGLTAIICQTGICTRIGIAATSGSLTHDPTAWILYTLLGWIGSQVIHNMMPGTNLKTSTSGEKIIK